MRKPRAANASPSNHSLCSGQRRKAGSHLTSHVAGGYCLPFRTTMKIWLPASLAAETHLTEQAGVSRAGHGNAHSHAPAAAVDHDAQTHPLFFNHAFRTSGRLRSLKLAAAGTSRRLQACKRYSPARPPPPTMFRLTNVRVLIAGTRCTICRFGIKSWPSRPTSTRRRSGLSCQERNHPEKRMNVNILF